MLDSEFKPEHNSIFKKNRGLFIFIASILIEAILIHTGSYLFTCGLNLMDMLCVIGPIGITFFINQKFYLKNKTYNWMTIIIGSGWNLFYGFLNHAIIC